MPVITIGRKDRRHIAGNAPACRISSFRAQRWAKSSTIRIRIFHIFLLYHRGLVRFLPAPNASSMTAQIFWRRAACPLDHAAPGRSQTERPMTRPRAGSSNIDDRGRVRRDKFQAIGRAVDIVSRAEYIRCRASAGRMRRLRSRGRRKLGKPACASRRASPLNHAAAVRAPLPGTKPRPKPTPARRACPARRERKTLQSWPTLPSWQR